MKTKKLKKKMIKLTLSPLLRKVDSGRGKVGYIQTTNTKHQKICNYYWFHQVRVSHTFQEANRCVDILAKGGCSLLEDFVVLDSPPYESLYVNLNSDASSLYFLRLSTTTLLFLAS